LSNYLKYIGTQVGHTVSVTAPGNDPENPSAGASSQTITADPGTVRAMDPAIAAAVVAKEPGQWEVVSDFEA
jgi:hypothetical protein